MGTPSAVRAAPEGGPCTCTYEGDQARYPRNGHGDLLVAPDLFEGGL